MYGIFTYIYHKIQPNVGKYTLMDGMGYELVIAGFLNHQQGSFRKTFHFFNGRKLASCSQS